MSIRYECEQCGSVLKIKEDLAGKPGKCPKCKTPFTVPEVSDDLENRELSDTSAETTEDSESKSPKASTSSGDDFDVDAFLSSDDEPVTKSSKSRRQELDLDAEQSLGESDDAPKSKRSKSRSDAESEGDNFQIRSGPDAPDKLAARGSNDESDSPPARRPPGTNPNAAASNIASDLLSKSAKKGKKTSWDQVEPEKKDKPEFDWDTLRYEAKTKLLPALGGAAVIFVLLYFVLMPMMGGGGYVPKLGIVTGTISVNGKPLPYSQVIFHPAERKHEVKGKSFKVGTSTGQTDATGRYEMMYDQTNPGVVIGKCRVEVMTTDYNGIQPKYFKNIPDAHTVEVKAGKQSFDLDLSK